MIRRIFSVLAMLLLSDTPLQAADPLFAQYIALGDSLTQGMQGTSTEETRQPGAYPALLAKAMATHYTQAPITFPGNSINDEDFMKGNVKWWQYYYPLIGGQRKDAYQNQTSLTNYGIAGATIADILHSPAENTGMAKLVLGKNGASAVTQALAKNPTFLSLWIGHNDVLKGMTRTDVNLMTPLADFQASLNQLVSKVKQTSSVQGVVIANLVDVTDLPYLTATRSSRFAKGSKHTYLVTDEAILTDAQVLDATELSHIQERVKQLNQAIKKVADDNHWAYVDLYSFYKNIIAQHGYRLHDSQGFSTNQGITADYLGGLFSLDGLHITTTGQAVFANQFIQAINQRYQTSLPAIDETLIAKNDSLLMAPVDPRQQ